MTKVKILLADDHLLMAEALKSLLVPTYDVVGTVCRRYGLAGGRWRSQTRFDRGRYRNAEIKWA